MLFSLNAKSASLIVAGLLVVGGVIAGVAIAGDGEFDPVSAPEWKSGYAFAYQVGAEVEYVLEAPGESRLDESFEVEPFPVEYEVLSTEYRASGQPMYISAATFPFGNILAGNPLDQSFAGKSVFAMAQRQYDLAFTPVMPDWDCRSNDCPGGGLKFGPENPLTYLSFPLTEGKRWEQEAPLPIELPEELEYLEGIEKIHMVGEVGQMESVDLPELGATDAVRIDFSYTPVGLQKKIQEIREETEKIGWKWDRLNIQLGMHEIAHYSPEYQAVVRDEYIIRALVDLGVDAEYRGESFRIDVYAEIGTYILAELTGADLVEKQELSPTQILDKLAGRQPLADAKGVSQAKKVQTYTLGVDSARDVINVAAGDEAVFRVDVAGQSVLPAGHTARFEILDLAGQVVEAGKLDLSSGSGAVLTEFEDPGVYSFFARTYDEYGSLTAQSGDSIVADYKIEFDADCYGIGSYVTYACEEARVPVREGIDSLVVEVSVDTPLANMPPISGGRLVLTDPVGHEYLGQRSGNEYRFQMDDFVDVVFGDWTLHFEENMGVLTEARYGIFLEYGASPQTLTESEPEASGEGTGQQMSLMGGLFGFVDQALSVTDGGEVSRSDIPLELFR